tara:strand:- start:249 stop:476 length:228 start_codon:yes stop_codon:yes gene_type:complete
VVIHRYAWEIPPYGHYDTWIKCICKVVGKNGLTQGILKAKDDAKNKTVKAFVFILAKNTITDRKLKQIDKLIYEL